MPRVPGYQPNQVGPVQTTGARFRAANNNGGVLGAIGEGMREIGGAAADFAEAQDRLNAQFDDTQARKESAALQGQYTAITTNFTALQGGNAVEQRAGIEKQIDELAKASVSRAANPRQRRMLEERIAELQTSARSLIGRHAQNEGIVERRATLKGQEAGFADSAASADDPEISTGYVTQGLGAVRARLDFEGIRDPLARSTAEREFTSSVHSAKIERWFQAVEPDIDMIGAYVEAHRDEMTGKAYAGVLHDLQQPLQSRADAADFMRAIGDAQPGGQSAPEVVGGRAAFKAATKAAESGGNPNAKNSRSSASGLYQFTDSTFLKTYRAEFPNSGMSDSAILARKNDPAVQERLMDRLTDQNADALRRAGHSETPGNLYLAHFAGAGGATKVLDAPRGASVASVLGDKVVAANPFLAGWSVDRLRQWAAEKAGATAASVSDSPQRWDKNDVYGRIEKLAAQEGWSPEKIERVKAQADRRIGRDEQLIDRQEREADRQAGEVVLGLGERFTSINQIPRALREKMSAADLAQYDAAAKRNSQPKEPPANGPAQMTLNQMRFLEPDKYMSLNLGQYVGQMTRAELDTHLGEQAKMRSDKGGWSPRSGIVTAVNYGKRIGGLDLQPEDETAIMQIMEAEATALYAKTQKPLTEQEYSALFQSATRNVTTHNQIFGYNISSSETPRYRLTEGQIPSATRKNITDRFKREMGREPTDDEVLRLYRVQTRR
jgi:soluble lytic murein transglycosylase